MNISHGKTRDYRAISRVFLASNPEWWVWLLSTLVWGILIAQADFSAAHFTESVHPKNLILCLPSGQYGGETFFPENGFIPTGNIPVFYDTVVLGIIPWAIMIFAMMFPLLKYPIRHIAFSVRQKNRNTGILLFLFGYTLIWSASGILFRFIQGLAEVLPDNFSFNILNLVAGLLFLLAAVLSWLPSRKVIMMKCDATMPIRLHGWSFVKDAVFYGMKIGMTCLRMCWIPMVGLMLVHHTVFWMLAVSFTVLIERYFVPPGSKSIGYTWALFGGIVLGSGIVS